MKGVKPPGRKKGTPNRVTASAREIFLAFLDQNAPRAQLWLSRVAKHDPKGALEVLLRVSEFFLPKLARTELTGANGAPLAGRTAPITDPIEAARIYGQIMGDPSIDLGTIKFESPAPLAAPATQQPAIEPQSLEAQAAEAPVNPPLAESRESNVVELSTWEKLAK